MPSKTFMNLDKDKKDKLMDAAMDEFSSIAYHDVSINKIIIKAGIPRGSFYMYFKDKDDLFEYLVERNHMRLKEEIRNTLAKYNGNLQKSFKNLYDIIINKIYSINYQGFFNNFFVFFNLRKKEKELPRHILFEYVKDIISTDNIKGTDKDLEFIFNMFMHNLFTSIVDTIKNDNSQEMKNNYLRKLEIICYGVYKEDK